MDPKNLIDSLKVVMEVLASNGEQELVNAVKAIKAEEQRKKVQQIQSQRCELFKIFTDEIMEKVIRTSFSENLTPSQFLTKVIYDHYNFNIKVLKNKQLENAFSTASVEDSIKILQSLR